MALLKENLSLAMFLLLKRDPTPFSADTLLSLFVPAYSEAGSNARSAQEGIMLNWDDYVREVAEGCMEESIPTHSNLSFVGVKEGDECMILEALLSFATGSKHIPVMGFTTRPMISFDLKSDGMVTSSTCSLCIRFTTRHCQEYESFKEDVTYCVFNSQGFGNV